MKGVTQALGRHAARLLAVAIVVMLYGLARIPEPDERERAALAARFGFTRAPLPTLAGDHTRSVRPVHPSLRHIGAWISSVGAHDEEVLAVDASGDRLRPRSDRALRHELREGCTDRLEGLALAGPERVHVAAERELRSLVPEWRRELGYEQDWGTGTIIAPLNSTMIAVALPAVSADLGSSVSDTSWLVSSYLIVMVCVQPLTGGLGDRFGRRPLLVAGLVGFGLASVGAMLAPNLGFLIAFRILQAVAGAVVFPNAVALLREFLPAERRGAAFGALGAVVGVAVGGVAGVAGWVCTWRVGSRARRVGSGPTRGARSSRAGRAGPGTPSHARPPGRSRPGSCTPWSGRRCGSPAWSPRR